MIDYIKNHKKKFLTITGIVCAVVCAVALSVGIIFGTVTNHRSSDADNNNYAESKHYAASIDASEVKIMSFISCLILISMRRQEVLPDGILEYTAGRIAGVGQEHKERHRPGT